MKLISVISILFALSFSTNAQTIFSTSLEFNEELTGVDTIYYAWISGIMLPDSSASLYVDLFDMEHNIQLIKYRFDLINPNLNKPGTQYFKNDSLHTFGIGEFGSHIKQAACHISIKDWHQELLYTDELDF